ncbi:tetratricopeptide repeat protein [Amycolatopsis magusensis]|uniref:tetratricopeptide repeat protein n=1 Tax=Amycolatopsis magusensis TaxID=882444 RepID=UPI003C2F90CF
MDAVNADTGPERETPRIFVSYAHDCAEHQEQVLAFCALLTRSGVEVHVDAWYTGQRRDWYAWMHEQIDLADFVVVIASPGYRGAGDGTGACHRNPGVRSEAAELRDRLHQDRETWVRKLFPVVLPGRSIDEIPRFLQPRCADHFLVAELTEAGIEELLRLFHGVPTHPRPELGPRPGLLPVPGTAPQPLLATTVTLPRDIPAFTGRADQLDELITPDGRAADSVTIYAIDGMPGVGKTAFAVHLAHQLAADYPDGLYFFDLHGHCAAQRPVEPADALQALLLGCGVAAEQIPAGLDERAGMWRDRMAGKRVLLLLDDAANHDQVRPLLPGTPGVLVVLTSRQRLAGLDDLHPLTLGLLPIDESVAMFSRLTRTPPSGHHPDAVARLMRLCGRLPLAIALTAGRLRSHPSWTVDYLAEQLTGSRDRLGELFAGSRSVRAAFELSYRDLTPGQQRLFRRLGLHLGTEFDLYAAAALDDADPDETRFNLDALYLNHLVEEPSPGRYRQHDLIRQYAVSLAGEDAAAVARLLGYYAHTAAEAGTAMAAHRKPPYVIAFDRPATMPDLSSDRRAAEWLATELANFTVCVDHAAMHGYAEYAISLSHALHPFLRRHGHWDRALEIHRTAAQVAHRKGCAAGEAWALTDLGAMQLLTGDYEPAMTNLTRACELFGELGDPPGHAQALTELGRAHYRRGDYPAAIANLTHALKLFDEHRERLGTGHVLTELGHVYYRVENFDAATTCLTEAYTLFGKLGHHLGQAHSLDRLANVRGRSGDYAEAGAGVTRAYHLYLELGDRQGLAHTLATMGRLQHRTGNFDMAMEHHRHAYGCYRKLGDRLGQAQSLNNLGRVLHSVGEYEDAVRKHHRALALHTELGDRIGRAHSLCNLGRTAVALEDYPASITCLSEAYEIYREVGSPNGQASALTYLGGARHATADIDGALAALEQARQLFGGDRAGHAEVLCRLGSIHLDLGDLAAAEGYFTEGLDIAAEIGAVMSIADARSGLGRCLVLMGRVEEGHALLADAVATYRRLGLLGRARFLSGWKHETPSGPEPGDRTLDPEENP